MKEKEKNPVLEATDQVVKNYEQAFRTGLKFQEELWESYRSVLEQWPFGTEWQNRMSHVTDPAGGLMPETQKRFKETVEVVEKNVKTGAELMKKAVEASQAPSVGESQSKWGEVLKGYYEAAQSNVQALMQINARMVDSYLKFAQKNAEFTHQPTAKAA